MQFLNELLVEVLRIGGPIALSVVVFFLLVRQLLKNLKGIKIKSRHAFVIILVSISSTFIVILLVFLKGETNAYSSIQIQGIISNSSGPLKGAYAFVVTPNDTIRSSMTGSDGVFSIDIDTIAGTPIVLHYRHPDHDWDSESILISSNQIHKKILEQLKKPASSSIDQPVEVKGEGCINSQLFEKIKRRARTGKARSIIIGLGYSKAGFFLVKEGDSPRFTYLGGTLEISVNGSLCATSEIAVPKSPSSIGKPKSTIENEVCHQVLELQKNEFIQNQIINEIFKCL